MAANNLVRRPGPFGGTGDVNRWVRDMRHFVRCVNPVHTEDDVVSAIADNLTGSAKVWAATQRDKDAASTFLARLAKKFDPFDQVEQAEDELESIRQTGTVRDFIERFEAVMARIDNVNDQEKRRSFVRGLDPKIRGKIKKGRPATYNEARRLALHEDANYDRQAAGQGGRPAPASSVSVGIHAMMGWQEHQALLDRRACFVCKQSGHFARDCPPSTDQRGGCRSGYRQRGYWQGGHPMVNSHEMAPQLHQQSFPPCFQPQQHNGQYFH